MAQEKPRKPLPFFDDLAKTRETLAIRLGCNQYRCPHIPYSKACYNRRDCPGAKNALAAGVVHKYLN